MEIKLELPIAPNANHRLLAAAEAKLLPALTAAEAVAWLKSLQQGDYRITRIDLNGPGDVFSSWVIAVISEDPSSFQLGDEVPT